MRLFARSTETADQPERTPSMKVFTVGLDEKAAQLKDQKVAMPPEPATPVPSPVLAVERQRRRPSGFKCVVVSLIALFFVLLFAMTLSEIAYNRQRDENFFRLRWAELKQRMGGYWDGPSLHDRLAALRRNNLEALAQTQTTTEEPSTSTNGDAQSTGDARFDFLRSLIAKIRESAEKAGLDGTMQVSLVQVDPPMDKQSIAQSFADGFGEFHQPQMNQLSIRPSKQLGPWPSDDFYPPQQQSDNDYDMGAPRGEFILPWSRPQQNLFIPFQHPSFFFPRDRFPMRPEWMNNEASNEDSSEQTQSDDMQQPQMRITHHFDGMGPGPQRVVTELFGDNAPDVLKQLLGQPDFSQQSQQSQIPRWTENSALPTFAFASQQQQQQQQQWQPQQPWQPPFDFGAFQQQQQGNAWDSRPWYQAGQQPDEQPHTWDFQIPSAFQPSQFAGPSNSLPQQQNSGPNFNSASWTPDMAAVDIPPAQPDTPIAPWQQIQSEPIVENQTPVKSAISFLPLREAEGEAHAQAAAAAASQEPEVHDSSAPVDSSEMAVDAVPVTGSVESELSPEPDLPEWKPDAVSLPDGVDSLPALDNHKDVDAPVGGDDKINFPAVQFPVHDAEVSKQRAPTNPLFLQVDDPQTNLS